MFTDIANLAADPTVLTLAADAPSWDEGILKVLGAVMKLAAVILFVVGVGKGGLMAMDGKLGKGLSIIVGTLVVVVFLWKPDLVNSMLDAMSGIGQATVDEVGNLTGGNTGGELP